MRYDRCSPILLIAPIKLWSHFHTSPVPITSSMATCHLPLGLHPLSIIHYPLSTTMYLSRPSSYPVMKLSKRLFGIRTRLATWEPPVLGVMPSCRLVRLALSTLCHTTCTRCTLAQSIIDVFLRRQSPPTNEAARFPPSSVELERDGLILHKRLIAQGIKNSPLLLPPR